MTKKKNPTKSLEEKLLKQLKGQNLTDAELKRVIKGMREPRKHRIKQYTHNETDEFLFGLLGDSHFGAKSTNKAALNDYYKKAYNDHGVREFYHAGDIVDGIPVHRGMIFEQYALGVDAQVEDVAKDYPSLEDAVTYFITGNHGLWAQKNVGVDVGNLIENKRDDLIYLGPEEADIQVAKAITLRLIHPGGGSSYALSYKPQKIIEAYSGGTKPNILGIGHFHKMIQMYYRNVHAFMTGTFENQTPFMRSKGLAAHVGGWVIKGRSHPKKGILEIQGLFIPYYD